LGVLAICCSAAPSASPALASGTPGASTRQAGTGQAGPGTTPDWGVVAEPPILPAKGPVDAVLDPQVARVMTAASLHGAPAALESAGALGMTVRGGRVRLVVEASEVALAKRGMAAKGIEIEASAGNLVQVMVPPALLDALGRLPGVHLVRAPFPHAAEAITGQGVSTIGATAWHAAGLTGSGVKVAIVDLGFAGLAAAKATGDLPASVATVDYCGGQLSTATEHGTGVAEIVHEVAPGAQLTLICVATEVGLAQALAYAKSNGITVINHSVSWYNTSRGDGSGGPGSPDAIAADARASGIVWVNAAGNDARDHWSGTFADNGSGWHLFAPGNTGNGFRLATGDSACAFLKWDDWPGSAQDFDLAILDALGNDLADSRGPQSGSEAPTEAVCYANPGVAAVFYVAINRYAGTATPRFDLFVTGADEIQYPVAAGSVTEPGSSPAVLAAGAVCWAATTIEPYSSRGPTIDGRVKPDLSGPDQVSGTTYGAFTNCSVLSGFAGTSAASPHLAGAAALARAAHPDYTVAQVRSWLTSNVVDLGTPGADNAFGAGLLRLPNPSVVSVALVSSANPAPVGASVTLTATVSPPSATGTVTFRDVTGGGSVDLGSVPLASGTAVLVTPLAVAGARSLVAEYGGDGSHPAATSEVLLQLVNGENLVATATSLAIQPNPVAVGAPATLTASVAPNPGAGFVSWIIDGVVAATTPVAPDGTAILARTWWSPATHTVRASFAEGTMFASSISPQVDLVVIAATSVSLAANRSAAVSGETLVTFTATMADADANGSVTFRDSVGGATRSLGTVPLTPNASLVPVAAVTVRLLGPGAHTIVATYGGNSVYGPATSGLASVTVVADTGVSASGVGTSLATFYPYRDGYRDTVALRGVPGEPLSVAIRVYSAAGRLVRSWSLATRTGPWSVAWNGRTASGVRVAAGRYRVVQALRDALGHTRTYTSTVAVSGKRLYWYSGTRTQYADAGSFTRTGGSSLVYRSASRARSVVLDGGGCQYNSVLGDDVCGLALGVHRITLPAAISYASIRFAVLGASRSGRGAGYAGVNHAATTEIDATRSIGRSWTWYATASVASSGHVSGRVVSGVVWATGTNLGLVEYQKVRVTYRYSLLK
jgi:hypothetical protein